MTNQRLKKLFNNKSSTDTNNNKKISTLNKTNKTDIENKKYFIISYT